MVSIIETLEEYVPNIRKNHRQYHRMMMTVHSQMPLKLIIFIIFSLVVINSRVLKLGGGGGGGAQRIRQNSQSRLEGLIPVVEDWHAKACFLGVSVYNKCSHLNILLPLFT